MLSSYLQNIIELKFSTFKMEILYEFRHQCICVCMHACPCMCLSFSITLKNSLDLFLLIFDTEKKNMIGNTKY